jgi:release factor glutamine methyltransferase
MKIQVTENVYRPAEDSFLIADQIPYYRSKRTLDIGTGSGILALVSAETAQEVVASDINPFAADCLKKNARLNGLDYKIDILVGDLFDPIRTGERFDLITFNPPYLPEDGYQAQRDYLDFSWSGGSNGRQVTDRFLEEFPRYLKRDGSILLVQSSLSGIRTTISKLRRKGFIAKVVASKHIHFEDIAVISCQMR